MRSPAQRPTDRDISNVRDVQIMFKTHSSGFGDFQDDQAIAIRPLHLHVKFFVSYDEDDVY